MLNGSSILDSISTTFDHLFHKETTADKCTRILKHSVDSKFKATEDFFDKFLGISDQQFLHGIMDMLESTTHSMIDTTKTMFDDESR